MNRLTEFGSVIIFVILVEICMSSIIIMRDPPPSNQQPAGPVQSPNRRTPQPGSNSTPPPNKDKPQPFRPIHLPNPPNLPQPPRNPDPFPGMQHGPWFPKTARVDFVPFGAFLLGAG